MTRPRTWLLALLLVLLAGIGVVAYPFLSNPDYAKALLLEQVQHEVGRKIDVGGARLDLFPRIRLELTDVVVWDADSSHKFFSARRVELFLRVFSLLQRRVIAKRLLLEGPKIELRKDVTGHWNFHSVLELPSSFARKGGKDTEPHNPIGLMMLVRQIGVQDGEVQIIDESRPDGIRTLRLGAVNASTTSKSGGVPIELMLTGKVLDAEGDSSLNFHGKVTHASLPMRTVQVDPAKTGPALQFDGKAELVDIDLRKMAEFFGPLPVPKEVRGTATMRGRIALVPGVLGYDMMLSEMKLAIQSVTVTGQASLAGLMTPQPTYSMTFSATPVDLRELMSGVPASWVHPQLETVLNEHAVDGLVEVVTATITGATAPEPRVSVTGEVMVSRGQAIVGRDHTQVENLGAKVVIEPDRVKVTQLSGSYGAIQVRAGKATVSFIQPGPWLEVEFTGETPAAEMISTLARSTKPAGVRDALQGLRDVKGNGQVTYHLAGSLREADGIEFLDGEFVFRQAEFSSSLAEGRVSDLNGRLRATPNMLKFDHFTARMGSSQIDFNGNIVLGETPAFEGVTLAMRGEAGHMIRFLTAKAIKNSGIQGALEIRASVSGSVGTPTLKGALELKDASLIVPGYVEKPVGKPAAIEFETTLRNAQWLNFTRLDMILPPLRIAGKGTLRLGMPFAMDAAFVSGPIAMAGGLPPGMTVLKGVESGTLEVSLDVKGRGPDWTTWQYNGWVALSDGVFAVKGLDHAAKGVYLRLKLDRNGGEVKRLAFNILDSDVALSGTIKNWSKVPVIAVKIESSDFDIDLVIPKGARSPLRDFLEELAATSRVVATVSIDRGRYKTLDFENLSARISIHDNALDIDRLNGQVDARGRVAAHLVLNLPKKQPADGEVAFQISDVPYAKLLQMLGDEKRMIIGDFSAGGILSADGVNPKGTLASVNGKVDFFFKKGRIQRGTIVPKLLSILHIGSVLQGRVDLAKEGLPFDKITGTFNIEKGVITVNPLVVDSPILKMSDAGTYDMAQDQLDMVLVASPLGPYAQALKSIPLFGKLFAGERRGIDTAIFEVKGSINEPRVEYMPLRSLTTGVSGLAQLAFDVLKNAVLLPKALIPDGTGGDQSTEPPVQNTP